MNRLALAVFGIGLLASAFAVAHPLRDEMAVQDSLRGMPRWQQVRWLARRGLPDPYLRAAEATDSGPLHVVGRWSYGPSTFVDVRTTATDTIVFLSRGSGVSIIRFLSHDSLSLRILADINCASLTGRLVVRDTLLFVGSGGLETYSISDLERPRLLSRFSYSAYDCFIKDTFLYTVNRESLRIYSVANVTAPRLLGGCRDSAYTMFVSGDYAYLGDQYGLYIVDVSNPATAHRVSSIGYDIISITARDSLLFFGTSDQGLKAYNVKNPASPVPLGSLSGVQPAFLYLPPTCDTVLYTPVFHAINIANPAGPRIIGQVSCPGWDYGVTAVPALNYALVADHYEGLVAVSIGNPTSPTVASQWYAADMANDVYLDGGRAYVAESKAGMRILDITDPTRPAPLGGVDTLFNGVRCPSVAAKDSFAYMAMYRPWFRSVDVTDPTRPTKAGACTISTEAQDMVVRDTFVYAAINYQFAILNVARPRSPTVVGTCNLPNAAMCLFLKDSLAFVGSWPSPIINIRDPAHPTAIGNINLPLGGIYVQDTFAYLAEDYDSFFVYSVANPATPVRLGGLDLSGGRPYGQYNLGVEVIDTIAYIGGWQLKAVSVADPRAPRETGTRWNPPSSYIPRLSFTSPYLFVACSEGGICIMETLQTGVNEHPGSVSAGSFLVAPSVTRGQVRVASSFAGKPFEVDAYDVEGALIRRQRSTGPSAVVDLTGAPDGAYLVVVRTKDGRSTTKVVKARR